MPDTSESTIANLAHKDWVSVGELQLDASPTKWKILNLPKIEWRALFVTRWKWTSCTVQLIHHFALILHHKASPLSQLI